MDGRIVYFTVHGRAAPQGSKTLGRTKAGRSFVRESSKAVGPWRDQVRLAAGQELAHRWAGSPLMRGPVRVRLVFHLPRPKGHFTGKGALRVSAPSYPAVAPDIDKLARAVLDGVTDVLIASDAQVVDLTCMKRYGEPARVTVTVTEVAAAVGGADGGAA